MKLPPNNYEFLILSYKALEFTSKNLKWHFSPQMDTDVTQMNTDALTLAFICVYLCSNVWKVSAI
jgi:hypothetical protein